MVAEARGGGVQGSRLIASGDGVVGEFIRGDVVIKLPLFFESIRKQS